MTKFIIQIICLIFLVSGLSAENYLLNGGQESEIRYKLVQKIVPTAETVTLNLSFVQPQDFKSHTYNQTIRDFLINPQLAPQNITQSQDKLGNKIIKYTWEKPRRAFDIVVTFVAKNTVNLKKIETNAPFPVGKLNEEIEFYLQSTELVQAGANVIHQKATSLTRDAQTQFDAVQKILTWIIDNMSYVLNPDEYDALTSMKTGKGNCQNYSHLAAAMMRSCGIPVRIVNGVTLKNPYDVQMDKQIMTLNMAEGRHSWIEVYFPDLGWMPFDPQQTELFVSNRFIRVEVGRDNAETENDGLVHWTRKKGATAVLSFQENIESEFMSDQSSFQGTRQSYGPKKLLLLPFVSAGFSRIETPVIAEKIEFDQSTISQLKFSKEYIFGNLDFPRNINFAFNRQSVDDESGTSHTLKKTFLVETAEYVTGAKQFCQVFNLDKALLLKSISLALQKFGGSGEVWLELREDDAGNPGLVAARSKPVLLNQMKLQQGYDWVKFDFSNQGLVLTPDKYWISIAQKGTPILNWFYAYGKPVGPIDGTRYKSTNDIGWEKNLSFEFNYRVTGLIPEY
jgi:transglutaminase-like putative cysteine protease